MHAGGVAVFDRQVAGEGGAAAENDGIELAAQAGGGPLRAGADGDAGFEHDTFGGQQVDAALDDFLLVEFHVRDAVHE